MLPQPTGGALCVWLDGRAGGEADHGSGHGAGGMQLRARTLDAGGALGPEQLLDDLVCDCCPTDAVALPDGSSVVVYRNRTEDEVRDIWTVRRAPDGGWSEPRPVYQDLWRIAGCPVNGPAVAAEGMTVASAWYTEGAAAGAAGGVPRVLVAFSADGGVSYSRPMEVSAGQTLGRVDIAPAGSGAFVVTYLAAPEGEPAGWTARVVSPGQDVGPPVEIAGVDPGRRSGRLSLAANPAQPGTLHAIWTVEDGVQAAELRLLPLPAAAPAAR
ncbi:MAG: hypothetical protein ACPGPE_06310 [Planctomycetota bacterium]